MRGWLVVVGLAAAAVARAETPQGEVPWYAGMPVADVRLVSPEGALPEESLEPLLRVLEGAPLDIHAMRLDLVTLYRVGEFSSVEADLEPWVVTVETGELLPAVLLSYVVHPAPVTAGVDVEGTDWLKDRDVLRAARVDIGEPFYEEMEGPVVEDRLLRLLRERGFPEGFAEVATTRIEDSHEVEVLLRIHEGQPVLVDQLSFAGDLPVPEPKLRRWVRKSGVKEGKPLSTTAVTEAQVKVRSELASLGGFFRKPRGYLSARVTPAITGDGRGGTLVTYTIEPGPRLELDITGLTWRRRAKVKEAIDLDERTRLTRGFVEGSSERMEGWLQERGFYAAHADVSLDEDPRERWQVLHVDIDRGPRHLLHRIDFQGNEAIADRDLRTVMDQASDEVVRLGRATEPELQEGVRAVRDVYRSRGYLDARVTLLDIRIAPRVRDINPGGRAPLFRSLTRMFQPKARYLIPEVLIDEGPLTRLVALEVQGAAPAVDLSFLEERQAALVGGPYSPQALQALAREVVDAHRRAGYLEADARVLRAPAGEEEMKAVLGVESGELVRLRSVVQRGARITRPRTIRREVPLELGQPVTSTHLDEIRRSLYDLDVFRTVSLELIGDEAARDLVLTVDERPLWAFELGGGIATDQGIRGFGRITRRNLWGLAHRVDLYGLIGFDWLGNSITDWTPDFLDPEWRAALSYTAPRFPWRRTELILDVLLRERMQERTWQMSRSGGGIALDTRLGKGVGMRGGARIENRRLVEVDTGALLPGEVWTELIDLADPDLPSPGRWQGSLYLIVLYDLRDSPLVPTRGMIFSVHGEWAPSFETPANPTVVSWMKAEVQVSGYIPIGGPILRLSGEGTYGGPLKGGILPLEDRYRLGGTGSVRGFRRDSVGPRNQVDQFTTDWPHQLAPAVEYAVRENPTRWVETGGDTRALGTLELLLPLPVLGLRAWDGYSVALFADVGNVWLANPEARAAATSDQEPWRSLYHPPVRYGVGLGLRVATPVGPLQVDLAANPEAMRAAGEVKQLLREEWREPTIRFHLSLGAL